MTGTRLKIRALLFMIVAAVGSALAAPYAIATFECLGIYWKPADGSANRRATVRFRE